MENPAMNLLIGLDLGVSQAAICGFEPD